MIFATACLFIAGLLKCAVRRTLFPVLFLGQIFSSFVFMIITISAGLLSDAWFPSNEVAFASAICNGAESAFGDAVSSVLSVQVITGPQKSYLNKTVPTDWANVSHPESEQAVKEVEQQILWMHIGLAVGGLLALVLTVVIFPHQPKYPPSLTEAKKILSREVTEYFQEKQTVSILIRDAIASTKSLMTNFNWLLLVSSGALTVGVSKRKRSKHIIKHESADLAL